MASSDGPVHALLITALGTPLLALIFVFFVPLIHAIKHVLLRFRKLWREPPWWVRDGVIALLIGLAVLYQQKNIDDDRASRERKVAQAQSSQAERLENLRYVRDKSSWAQMDRPFAGMDLKEMNLAGLDLFGADFTGADLRGANLSSTTLASSSDPALNGPLAANLSGANLCSANLMGATLTGASLVRANLRGANLTFARLGGADLSGADLTGAWVDKAMFEQLANGTDPAIPGVYYNGETKWPDDWLEFLPTQIKKNAEQQWHDMTNVIRPPKPECGQGWGDAPRLQ